jgi:hypothetical protein
MPSDGSRGTSSAGRLAGRGADFHEVIEPWANAYKMDDFGALV